MNVDKYLDTIAEQNIFNNHNGEIPNSSFINRWHNETTQDFIDIMKACWQHIDAATPNDTLQDLMIDLSVWIKHMDKVQKQKGFQFNNVCNPSPKEINQVKKGFAWDFKTEGNNIKSKYFRCKRLMAEYYNKEYGIQIQNKDTDINNYPLDWNGLRPQEDMNYAN